MDISTFDCSFFGYQNLPHSLEVNNRKLIPIKALKLKYTGNSMSGGAFRAHDIRQLCEFLGIEVHRPVKGLYCIEESYVKFFDYLYQLFTDGLIDNWLWRDYEKIKGLFCSFV